MAAGTVVAQLDQVQVCGVIVDDRSNNDEAQRVDILKQMVDRVDPDVNNHDREKLNALLLEFASAFSLSEDELGRTSVAKHAIDTGSARPVRQRLRRQPPTYQTIIKEHVDSSSMLKQGVIVPA